jgi:flavodoxin I
LARIGLFYGSNEGNTAHAGDQIKESFDRYEKDVVRVFNIADVTIDDVAKWKYIVFGISTWDIGQLQDDWDIFLPKMDDLDLTGKKVAIYGLGDQYGYPDTYIDAVGVLADKVMEQGGELYGLWPKKGYEISGSRAEIEDHLLGLGLDTDNEASKSKPRVAAWVDQLAFAWGLTEKSPFEFEAQPVEA